MNTQTESETLFIKEQVRKTYPDFTPEDVEAFLVYLSLRQRRTEVYKRLADS
jgi:uncharacterized protein (DUF433 family)